ncbi:unnamed protein product [Rotaria magnacalcarata]|uniref:Uncharacterized protein n=1 Tax=Rotaria magnacalcarata TaxID=392030 RepID=A0A816ZT86_9BILA|nr:unnamed protein product [Rotaria magnacalcarata]
MIKDKFTPWEIQEVEDLAKVMGKEKIASHFTITAYVFDNLRKSQPELEEAYKRGVNARKSGTKFQKRKRTLETTSKSMPIELSQDEAWAKFKEEFDANKKKRRIMSKTVTYEQIDTHILNKKVLSEYNSINSEEEKSNFYGECYSGNLEGIKSLIKKNQNFPAFIKAINSVETLFYIINGNDDSKELAVQKDDISLVQFLMNNEVKINSHDDGILLYYAAQKNDYDMFFLLKDSGIDIDSELLQDIKVSMKKDISLEEYSKAAFEWDMWYAKLHNLSLEKAIRVEQGEYTVASCDQKLGTYNVRQCVVVYLATEKMHGLAHVDGHTEIKSLKSYVDALNITKENPLIHVKIIGASSSTVMGLNNSEENLRKISSFLEDLLDKAIVHNKSLPIGMYDKEQALHTIQEIKRIDKYSGTYPIIKANDGHNKDKTRSKWDTNNYKAFDEAIPIILEEWKKSAGTISNVFKISTISHLFIGEDSIELNKDSVFQNKPYVNSANIDTVLEYCFSIDKNSIDKNLNIIKIKNILKNQYKENFNYGILEYDAVINAKSLLTVIFGRSPLLNKLMALNSQGASDLDGNQYKIQDIKAVLDEKERIILEKIINDYNLKLLNSEENIVGKEQFNQFISIQFQSREKPLLRKDKILLEQQRKNIEDFCSQREFDFNQVSQSIGNRCKEYQNIQINKNKITDQSNFFVYNLSF